MTAGEAIERCEQLRPGSRIPAHTRQRWLYEADGLLRAQYFAQNTAAAAVGADLAWEDGLADETVLLVPAPYDALYVHYLCAMTDAALGETDRYTGEQAQYNALLAGLAVWLRRSAKPPAGAHWRT